MYARQKKRPGHAEDAMQIAIRVVETSRIDGRSRQRVLLHVGLARSDEELAQLVRYGEYLKQRLEEASSGSLFAVEAVAKPTQTPRRRRTTAKVAVERLQHGQSVKTGVAAVYQPAYEALQLDWVLPAARYQKAHGLLRDLVLARLVEPQSKRATATQFDVTYGAPVSVDALYRMMDHLDEARIQQVKQRIADAHRSLLPDPVRVVLFDCTTLYFESTSNDALRAFGYSKDGKMNRVQVLLALVVDPQGLPLTYELFPGNQFEGQALVPVIRQFRAQFRGLENEMLVADAGMSTRDR